MGTAAEPAVAGAASATAAADGGGAGGSAATGDDPGRGGAAEGEATKESRGGPLAVDRWGVRKVARPVANSSTVTTATTANAEPTPKSAGRTTCRLSVRVGDVRVIGDAVPGSAELAAIGVASGCAIVACKSAPSPPGDGPGEGVHG